MCGRVRLSSDYSEIKIKLKFAPDSVAPNFEADWNKPPTTPMLVAIRSEDGKRDYPEDDEVGSHSSLVERRQASVFDLQRPIGRFQDQALVPRAMEVGPAMPRRYGRILRVEKAGSERKGETTLRDRHDGRCADGHGRPLGEMEVAERRRDTELHDPHVRSEQRSRGVA